MSITYNDIANGETLLAIRTKINNWGATVQDTINSLLTTVATNTANISLNTTAIGTNTSNIATNTADIVDHETRISAAEVSVGELTNIGISHMTNNAATISNNVTTTPAKLDWAGAVNHEYGSAITGNFTADTFTINSTGVYKVFGTIQFEAANGNEALFYLYNNGTPISTPLLGIGKGAGKPVNLVYTNLDDFTADDVLSIYVAGDSSYTLDIIGASVIVERTPYPLT